MYLRFCRIALIVVFVLGLAACSDSPTENQADLEAQFVVSQGIAVNTSGFVETAALTYSVANLVPGLAKSAVLSDTLFPNFLTCPYLVWDGPSKQFTLDYGNGCTNANGKTRSGKITIQYNGRVSTGATLTLTYINYKANNKTFNGQVMVTIANNAAAIEIKNGAVTSEKGTAKIDANLALTADFKGTPQNPADDVYLVSGSGTVVDTDSKTYNFTITEPLRFQMNCNYPTAGKMTVSGGNGQPATVDFFPENGACDDIVVVTIGNASRTIHLDQ
jgi:hypothetical protein